MSPALIKFIGSSVMIFIALLVGASAGWEYVILLGLGYIGVIILAIGLEVDYEHHALDRE